MHLTELFLSIYYDLAITSLVVSSIIPLCFFFYPFHQLPVQGVPPGLSCT